MRLLRAYAPNGQPAPKRSLPASPQSILNSVDDRIRVLFDRAADPSTHFVTIASAKKAGVGFFADHFSDMDHDRNGSLRFSEVKSFLDGQSPIARPVAAEGIQIIE